MQSRKPLSTKVALASKTSLVAKSGLKANLKPKKRPKPSLTKLRHKAHELFSQMVRLRDCDLVNGEFVGTCITCSKRGVVAWLDETGKLRFTRGWDAGHYIGRGNKYLVYDEENVNLQCSFNCNNMKSGNIQKYKVALDLKYGDGTRKKLDEDAATHKNYKLKRADYEQVIKDSAEIVGFYKERRLSLHGKYGRAR